MNRLLLVCLGGAVGSGARYLMGRWLHDPESVHAWGTWAVNILGSFLLGLLVVTTESLPPAVRLGLTTGLMGGFTTYSTFSLETLQHLQRGAPGYAALNVALTLIVCLAASAVGYVVGRAII